MGKTQMKELTFIQVLPWVPNRVQFKKPYILPWGDENEVMHKKLYRHYLL